MVQGVEALFLSCIAGKHFGLPVSGAIAAHVCILACVLDLLKEKKTTCCWTVNQASDINGCNNCVKTWCKTGTNNLDRG